MMIDELNSTSECRAQHSSFAINESRTSQLPALQLLIAIGYEYISPEKALAERQGRISNVLLENILRGQLKEINRIRYKTQKRGLMQRLLIGQWRITPDIVKTFEEM